MKKTLLLVAAIIVTLVCFGQKATGKLKFETGQVLQLNMDVNTSFTQQMMGNAVDFTVKGTAVHQYKVTNATDDNSTLRHEMNRLSFQFDGMGQKMNFDSDNPKDMEGRMGKPVKEILEKNYDMIIDPNGKVLMAQPEKVSFGAMDERMRIVTDMLKELLDVVQPPQKGAGSFFRVLPENEAAIGESWSENGKTSNGEFTNVYTLAEVNDTIIVVNLNGTSTATTKADMMGMETTTKLNLKTTGVIIVDKANGVVKQKTLNTESAGTMEVMGNSLPVSSKTKTVITVTPTQ